MSGQKIRMFSYLYHRAYCPLEENMVVAWKAPLDYPEKMIGSYGPEAGSYENENSNFNYLALFDGKLFPEGMDEPHIFFVQPENKIQEKDCLWLLGGVPLISARLAQFIQSHAPSSTQMIRPKALHAAGIKTSLDYFILNITQTANVIDLDKSDAEKNENGEIIYFNNKTLKSEYEFNAPLAREALSHEILISKSFAQALLQNKFSVVDNWGFCTMDNRYTPYPAGYA